MKLEAKRPKDLIEVVNRFNKECGKSIDSVMLCGKRCLIIHTRSSLDTFLNKFGEYMSDSLFISVFRDYIDWDILEKYDHAVFNYFEYKILVVEKQANLKLTGSKNRKIEPKYTSKFLNHIK